MAAPEEFGEQVTADHIISRGELGKSFKKHNDALLLFGRATRYIDCYPVENKSADLSYRAIRDFRCGTYIHRLHTDGSPELKKACDEFGFPHSTAPLGRPQRNGVIENKVRLI